MESVYWHSHQQENWDVLPTEPNQQATGGLSRGFGGQFPDSRASEAVVLEPTVFTSEIQLLSAIKNVMRKMAMIVVGITLFVAGYRHTHRQTAYVTAQAALSNSGYATTPKVVPDNIKQTVAFRLVQPL
ncbi:hypothetical protein [Spirosoma endbachense]|uniref:Uncharacterized protein n=1 Tax=Spirosoma endbachense TaxID=2666025 RepID=A0A6P1VSQ5_9BACT|nr:hypothetical protein [Spirosoma endbachense]QHV95448.1 hypothetical protein GJR95_10700 [Spirosoma endbachense]